MKYFAALGKARALQKILAAHGPKDLFLFLKYRFALALAGACSRLAAFDSDKDPTRRQFDAFVGRVNSLKRPRILELGSRNISHRARFADDSEYVGFDINPGKGVDVVGDIHSLSAHFPAGHFDAVYAVSVFEHLAMPWKAAHEISKVLKPGGILFLFTHPAFPLHAEPWDFWRFSRWTFPVLFNARTGYAILECNQGLPCVILPLAHSSSTKGMRSQLSYMGVALTAQKTGEADASLAWDLDASFYSEQGYPKEYAAERKFFEYLDERDKAGGA